MTNRLRRALTIALALFSITCGSDDTKEPLPIAVTVTIGPGAVNSVTNGVKANGLNLVSILVSGSTKPPIRLSTGRGVFPGGNRSLLISSDSATVNLITCDARSDSSCAGATTVTATDAAGGFGQAMITFVGYETVCNNLRDDNRDNRTDCTDPDCDQAECVDVTANAGVCQSGACVPAACVPAAENEICDNGVDDDCDRQIDCEQPGCDGLPCRAGEPAFTCQSRACTDAGTGYGISLTARRTRIPADGVATTAVTARVVKNGAVQVGVPVDFSTDLGTLLAPSATTGADGTATVTYQAPPSSGTATITAALRGGLSQVKTTAFVEMPALGTISVATTQTQVMGVKFSGFNEQNLVSVLVLDDQQRPYPDGLAVRFEHQQLGGSNISAPHTDDTMTCKALNGCLGFLGATASAPGRQDMQGLASFTLFSGTAAGPISVIVSATAGGVTRNFTIQNMAVVGAKASGLHTSLRCLRRAEPAFTKQDCTNSFFAGSFACTVFLADRFNNVLGVSTRADFRSEAGSAGPPVVTKDFDPTKGGDQTADLGHATNTISINGYTLPKDVPPVSGEFAKEYDSGCGKRMHNPRDGLSSVIVAVPGEEGFVDLNANGVYDMGEPFVDSGEPFVDTDDNGIRESDEPFIDVNQNGVWDGPNGKWDGNGVIWAEDRVLYTGNLGTVADNGSRWFDALDANDPNQPPLPTAPASYEVTILPPAGDSLMVWLSDPRFNPLSNRATYTLATTAGDVSALFAREPTATDTIGATLTQQFCDKAPPATATACDSTCKTAPCFRVAKLSEFKYGRDGVVVITPGATLGSGSVRLSSAIGDDVTGISVSGVTK